MTGFEMTKDEATELARFVAKIRERVPGGTWHRAGIEDALGQARHRAPAPDLACAAIRAAVSPSNRTPAIIGMDGPHWREATAPLRPEKVDPNLRCSVCSESQGTCRLKWSADHDFLSTVEAKRTAASTEGVHVAVTALREDLPPMAEPERRHTLDDLAARDPALRGRVDALRAAIPTEPMREPEPESEPA